MTAYRYCHDTEDFCCGQRVECAFATFNGEPTWVEGIVDEITPTGYVRIRRLSGAPMPAVSPKSIRIRTQ